ncbi:hypothetical protein JCM18237_16450 [Halorubrum luteum]
MNGGDKGRNAEQAIVEYLPPSYRPDRFRDDLDSLEGDLRADLQQVGGLSDDSSLNEVPASRSGGATEKITWRVSADVQDALEQYVYDQENKLRRVVGDYIATALDEYRDGGRVGRIRRYYERLRESADFISHDRVGDIVETLRQKHEDTDYYHLEQIKLAVDETIEVHSEDVRRDFVDRVIEHLGFVSVETSDGVYATPDRAKQTVQEFEIESDTDYHSLEKEGRAEYLKDALKARSRQNKGASVHYKTAREDIFNGAPSIQYTYDLMELAGEDSGFTYGEYNGQIRLRYTDHGDSTLNDPSDGWKSRAIELIERFCEDNGMDPAEVDQPIIDNHIVQAKYPEEYTEAQFAESADETGPSERAMNSVTKDDREYVRTRLTGSASNSESRVESQASEEMDLLTKEADAATDGGHLGN